MDRQNRNVVGTGGGSGKRLGGGGTVHPGYGSLRRAAYRIIRYVCFFFLLRGCHLLVRRQASLQPVLHREI